MPIHPERGSSAARMSQVLAMPAPEPRQSPVDGHPDPAINSTAAPLTRIGWRIRSMPSTTSLRPPPARQRVQRRRRSPRPASPNECRRGPGADPSCLSRNENIQAAASGHMWPQSASTPFDPDQSRPPVPQRVAQVSATCDHQRARARRLRGVTVRLSPRRCSL